MLSLSHSRNGDGDWSETLGTDKDRENQKRQDELEVVKVWARAILKRLPVRVRKFAELRFGIGWGGELTLDEIGKVAGLTKERVRQLLGKSFNRVREREGVA